jgi:hypothetical protein
MIEPDLLYFEIFIKDKQEKGTIGSLYDRFISVSGIDFRTELCGKLSISRIVISVSFAR